MRKTPLNMEMLRDLIGEDLTKKFMARHPGALRKESGEDPTIFAAQHGYESVEAMVSELLALPKKADAIKARVQELDAEFDRQYDATTELLNTEELTEHAELVAKHISRMARSESIRQYVQRQAIVKIAAAELAKKPMKEAMKPGKYRDNMRRALVQERKALREKDYDTALKANTKVRINLEMAKMSQDLKEACEKMERRVKRFLDSKSVADTPKYLLAAFAEQHSVMEIPSRLASNNMESAREWLTSLEADGYTLALDPNVMTSTTPWREMTMEKFRDLLNAFNQIIVTERNQRKLLTAKGKAELEAVANDIAASVMDHGKPLPQKTVEKENSISKLLGNIHASHMKIEELCIQMDGGKVGGPCWTYIYKPIADADNDQALRLRDIRNYIKEKLFSMYSPAELSKMGEKKTLVPEIGESITYAPPPGACT